MEASLELTGTLSPDQTPPEVWLVGSQITHGASLNGDMESSPFLFEMDPQWEKEMHRRTQNRIYQRRHRQRIKETVASAKKADTEKRTQDPRLQGAGLMDVQFPPSERQVVSRMPPPPPLHTEVTGPDAPDPDPPCPPTDIVENSPSTPFTGCAATPFDKGNTALHQAVLGGQESVVRLLLARGADTRAVNGLGRTPMHLAALSGNVHMMDLLGYDKALLTVTDHKGLTALHLAAMAGHHAIVVKLLDHGVDINTPVTT